MKLFYFKPKPFSPVQVLISKIASQDEFEKIEAWTHEVCQILHDQKDANDETILIFSIIQDHKKKTTNLVLPCIKSNDKLVTRCENDQKFMNSLIVETLNKSDTEYYLEILDSKVLIHQLHLNLMALSKFYII